MDAKIQVITINQAMVEVKKAPIVLMEDNLTKAKRALMTPKQLCPSGLEIPAIEGKTKIRERGVSRLTQLRETMIRKSREYHMSLPKYNGDWKVGQAW